MHLQHVHLWRLTPYLRACSIQSQLVALHLAHKSLTPALRAQTRPPPPILLTFETPPTYTCGRRETGTLTKDQISQLCAGGRAEFFESPRGGQTTFHGPGQLTAFLILDLLAHDLTARTHIHLLEQAVIETCAGYGVFGHRTENPGVWVSEAEKIASVGVHLRRHVAAFGVGLNVSTGLEWFDRIVACGLVGKRATSLRKEGVNPAGGVEGVGLVLAKRVAKLLVGVEGLEPVWLHEVARRFQKPFRSLELVGRDVVDGGFDVGSEVGSSGAKWAGGKG